MEPGNRRRAARIECDLPIRLEGLDGDLAARIVDSSRTGIRVRISGAMLGVHRLSSLVQVTRRLQEVLGDTFAAELHHEVLGSLVRRLLAPTRIAKRDWEKTDVEVGCALDRPLTDEEASMLGLDLPALPSQREPPEPSSGESPEPQSGESPRKAPALRAVRRPHIRRPEPEAIMAYVYPAPGKTAAPLSTTALSLSPGTAVLAIQPGQGWDTPDPAVVDLVMAIDEAYGTSILLRIVEGDHDLWSGPAEIQEVDATAGNTAVRLGVTFGRELRSEELSRLGLPAPA